MAKLKSAYDKDDLYRILDRINFWIENSDTKASILIATLGIIFTIFLTEDYLLKYKEIIKALKISESYFYYVYIFLILISILILGTGCYYLFRVLIPKLDVNLYQEKGLEKKSLIFFSTIARNKSYNSYENKIENSTKADKKKDLISQIYINSKICDEKFNNYKKGFAFSLVGFMMNIFIFILGILVK